MTTIPSKPLKAVIPFARDMANEVSHTQSVVQAPQAARRVIVSSAQVLSHSINEVLDSGSFDLVKRLKFKKILRSCIKDIMQPANYINCGKDSKVYRINDEFVAKVKRGKYSKNQVVPFFSYPTCPNAHVRDIGCYYGAPILKVGNVEILRNADAASDAIVCGAEFKGRATETADQLKYYYETYLPKCASLPQESYDELAMGLSKLNQKTSLYCKIKTPKDAHGYPLINNKTFCTKRLGMAHFMPDTINPNNIIISGNRFRLVDDLLMTDMSKKPNTVYSMLQPLLLELHSHSVAKPKEGFEDMRKNIFYKIIIAANRANLPMGTPDELKIEYCDYFLGPIIKDNMNILSHLQHMMEKGASVAEREAYIREYMANKGICLSQKTAHLQPKKA